MLSIKISHKLYREYLKSKRKQIARNESNLLTWILIISQICGDLLYCIIYCGFFILAVAKIILFFVNESIFHCINFLFITCYHITAEWNFKVFCFLCKNRKNSRYHQSLFIFLSHLNLFTVLKFIFVLFITYFFVLFVVISFKHISMTSYVTKVQQRFRNEFELHHTLIKQINITYDTCVAS